MKVFEYFKTNPDLFTTGQTYSLIEENFGKHFPDPPNPEIQDILVKRVESVDKTPTLLLKKKLFEYMAMSTEEKIALLKEFLINPDQKHSIEELEVLSGALTSERYSKEHNRLYYGTIMDNLLTCIRNNSKAYARKVLLWLIPTSDQPEIIKPKLKEVFDELTEEEEYIKSAIIKLAVL